MAAHFSLRHTHTPLHWFCVLLLYNSSNLLKHLKLHHSAEYAKIFSTAQWTEEAFTTHFIDELFQQRCVFFV